MAAIDVTARTVRVPRSAHLGMEMLSARASNNCQRPPDRHILTWKPCQQDCKSQQELSAAPRPAHLDMQILPARDSNQRFRCRSAHLDMEILPARDSKSHTARHFQQSASIARVTNGVVIGHSMGTGESAVPEESKGDLQMALPSRKSNDFMHCPGNASGISTSAIKS